MRVKKSILATASVLALGLITTANAADLSVDGRTVAPALTGPAQVFSWTGCFVGAHVGYGLATKDWHGTSSSGYLTSSMHPDGVMGGGQVGCDYQFPSSNWVVGIQGSISAAGLNGSAVDGYSSPAYTDTSKVNALGSVTGRIGWTWTRQNILYARGGLAWASDTYNNNYYGPGGESATANRIGWILGLGSEWAFARDWSFFAEYDHYDFGSTKLVFTDTYVSSIAQKVNAFTVGINYHFGMGTGAGSARY